jgi:hypothetical protein
MRQQDGIGNQQHDPDTDDNKGGPQPEQDQDAQPQQQKQPRMLTNLARYNAPGIKDNKKCHGNATTRTDTRWQTNMTRRGTGLRNQTCNTGKNSKE